MTLTAERAENVAMLRDSAAAIVPPGGDLRRVRALRFKPPGFDPAVWRTMAEMGWLGLRVPEADGGSGLGMAELCALAETLGGGLAPEPFVPGVMAATLLPRPAVLDGTQIVLPAWQEAPDTLEIGPGTAIAGDRVTGAKLFVPMAAGADAFLVCTPGGLALVDAHAPGVTIDLAATQDGGSFGTIRFENAPAEALPGDPAAVIEGSLPRQRRHPARRDGALLRADARFHAHPQAVRQADRQLPGAAAPRRRFEAADRAQPREYRGGRRNARFRRRLTHMPGGGVACEGRVHRMRPCW